MIWNPSNKTEGQSGDLPRYWWSCWSFPDWPCHELACLQWFTSRNTKLKSHELDQISDQPLIISAFALEANFQATSISLDDFHSKMTVEDVEEDDDSWLFLPWTMARHNRRQSDLIEAIIVSPPISPAPLSWVQPPLFSTTDQDLVLGSLDQIRLSEQNSSLTHLTAMLRVTLNVSQC